MPRYLVETTVTLTKLHDIEAANEVDAVEIAMQRNQRVLRGLFNPLNSFRVSEQGRVEREIKHATTDGSTTTPPAAPPPPPVSPAAR